MCFFIIEATTVIYTLSLHDALPIFRPPAADGIEPTGHPDGPDAARLRPVLHGDRDHVHDGKRGLPHVHAPVGDRDRKSTRLNSSHSQISYAVFCLIKTTN